MSYLLHWTWCGIKVGSSCEGLSPVILMPTPVWPSGISTINIHGVGPITARVRLTEFRKNIKITWQARCTPKFYPEEGLGGTHFAF